MSARVTVTLSVRHYWLLSLFHIVCGIGSGFAMCRMLHSLGWLK
jgi:hypothetical protein